MRGKRIDPEQEAEIIAALIGGLSIRDTARKFSLPDTTVRRIANGLGDQLAKVGEKKLEDIGDMLVDLISANVEGMKAIARQATHEHYTEKHSPAALAQLYDTIADTTVRLLEAAGSVADAVEESGE